MIPAGETGGRAAEARMLASAVGYALATVRAVTPDLLPRPTPCRGWDLRMLLRHAAESLAALREGLGTGRVGLYPSADDPAADPVAAFCERARLLLAACAMAGGAPGAVAIADRCLPPGLVATAGALEIAVHGWDVSRASGHRRPIPAALAADLLVMAPLLVPGDDRDPLFAPAVPVGATAGPSDRLAAFLGRVPHS